MSYIRPRDVLCTSCGADRGDLCRNRRGEEVRYTHAARDRRAQSKLRRYGGDYPAHHSKPLTVPCPECEVEVGRECNWDATRPTRRWHQARYTAAVETWLRQAGERRREEHLRPPAPDICPSCGAEIEARGAA